MQNRLSLLENSENSLKQKLQEAQDEIEKAKKACREYQFRIKQLQEQCIFLEKSKKKDTSKPVVEPSVSHKSPTKASHASSKKDDTNAPVVPVVSAVAVAVDVPPAEISVVVHPLPIPDPTQDPECDAPSWMK